MSVITTASFIDEPDLAANHIAVALDLKRTRRMGDFTADYFPPHLGTDRMDWRRSSNEHRLMRIGAWLNYLAFEAIAAGTVMVPYEPIGGEKYAHQND